MPKFLDLSGVVFGKLRVLKRGENIGKVVAWICECKCGREKLIRSNSLRMGTARSCRQKFCGFEEFSGKRFGAWEVIKRVENRKRAISFLCRCSCGKTSTVFLQCLRDGSSRSCGCLSKHAPRYIIHGATSGRKQTSEWRSWQAAKNRCLNPNSKHFNSYGGRGISMCPKWFNSFSNFFKDMGEIPGLNFSLDRIDNNGNYEPGNCRWATKKEQSNNRRNSIKIDFDRKIFNAKQFADYIGVSNSTLCLWNKKHGTKPELFLSLAKNKRRHLPRHWPLNKSKNTHSVNKQSQSN